MRKISIVLLFGLIGLVTTHAQNLDDQFMVSTSGSQSSYPPQLNQDDYTQYVGIGVASASGTGNQLGAALTVSNANFTTSPVGILEIINTTSTSTAGNSQFGFAVLRASSSTPLSPSALDFSVDNNGLVGIGIQATNYTHGTLSGVHLFVTDPLPYNSATSLPLLLASTHGGYPGLFVDATGYVGIGNVVPADPLDVVGTAVFRNDAIVVGNTYTDGNTYQFGTLLTSGVADFDNDVNVSGNALVSGNVGIGTYTPAVALDVVGDAHVSNIVYSNGVNTVGNVNVGQSVSVAVNEYIGGYVQIGATKPVTSAYTPFMLSVAGNVVAQNVQVETSDWADYVFDKTYKLASLSEIEAYIRQNKHLSGVPSECEAIEKGVNLGEMNKLLLQKVEELTLYMIQQQKEIEELKAKK